GSSSRRISCTASKSSENDRSSPHGASADTGWSKGSRVMARLWNGEKILEADLGAAPPRSSGEHVSSCVRGARRRSRIGAMIEPSPCTGECAMDLQHPLVQSIAAPLLLALAGGAALRAVL